MNQIIADSSSMHHHHYQMQSNSSSTSASANSNNNSQQHLQSSLSGATLIVPNSNGTPGPSSSPSLTSSDNYTLNPAPENVEEQLHYLREFLNTAPSKFSPTESIKRFPLGNNESIACVAWREGFYISGTDIVKILSYRFQIIGRYIANQKKFEEGIFSDLRSLKPGVDAVLEDARSEFLEMLYKNNCIRTQKKQKVFFWYSVNHERLFQDALERDRKRESLVYPGHHQQQQHSHAHSSRLQASNYLQQQQQFGNIVSSAAVAGNQYIQQHQLFQQHQQPKGQSLQIHSHAGTIDPLNLYFAQSDHHHMHHQLLNSHSSSNGLPVYQSLSPNSYPSNGHLPMSIVESNNSEDIQISFDDPSLCEFLNMSIDPNGLQFSTGSSIVGNGTSGGGDISAAF